VAEHSECPTEGVRRAAPLCCHLGIYDRMKMAAPSPKQTRKKAINAKAATRSRGNIA
jgi:hypothetical protein